MVKPNHFLLFPEPKNDFSSGRNNNKKNAHHSRKGCCYQKLFSYSESQTNFQTISIDGRILYFPSLLIRNKKNSIFISNKDSRTLAIKSFLKKNSQYEKKTEQFLSCCWRNDKFLLCGEKKKEKKSPIDAFLRKLFTL